MKMIQPKKHMANLLMVACLLTSAVGIATVKGVATGEETTPAPVVTYETLAMEEGASVRIADKKEDAGIRFRLKMSKTEYEAITAQNSPYTNVSFGVLVAPEDYLTAGHELNEKNVFGIGGEAIYGWATRNEDGTWNEYEGNKVEIINFNTTTLSLKEGEYRFDGSLVDIMDGTETTTNNVSREFRAVGYMLYTEGTTQKVAMVGDDTNVRSIAYVAQKAIEAGQIKDSTDIENLTKFYITGVKSKATVKYYKYGANGYELADTVMSDDMQIGDIFTAEQKSYTGYIFGKANSELSGKVYASERTTLNVYYNPMDNLAPTVDSWALMQNGRYRANKTILSYTPTVDKLEFALEGESQVHYIVSNLSADNALYKFQGEDKTETTYKDKAGVEKEVAQVYPMYANNNMHPVLMGANLAGMSKTDLQSLSENGYTRLTFSFVFTDYSLGARNAGYFVLNLDSVKADPTITIRNQDGTVNLNAFEEIKTTGYKVDGVSVSNNLANNWYTVEYSIADLIACYDQLFAGEDYWTLAIPYGTIGNNKNAEGEVCGYFYTTKLVFTKIADDLSNVLPTANDWAVMLGGYSLDNRMGLDYKPEYTPETVEYIKAGSSSELLVVASNDNNKTGYLGFNKHAGLSGQAENITYKNKEVGFSFPLLPNNKSLPIFIGAGLSHVTKADLQMLLELGYKNLSFSFVHSTCEGVAQDWGYYLLDLEAVKNDSTITFRNATYTHSDGNSYENTVNLNALEKHNIPYTGSGTNYQNNDNGKTREWVDVEYAIADLIACYDQLFAGEDYWTLAIPYGDVGHYNKGTTTAGECGRTYVTKLAFTK